MVTKTIDLACIGSCCVDVIMNVQDVFRFEMMEANEPDLIKKYTAIEYSSKLNVKKLKIAAGGSAANVASNLSNLGMSTAYIGKLGDDFFGQISKNDLKDTGVDIDACFFTKEDHTGVSVVLITPFGKDRSILSYKGANDLIRPEEIKPEWVAKAQNLQWTSLTSDSGVASIEKCIEILKKRNGKSMVFACPSISIIKNNLEGARKLVAKSDVLTLNKEEIQGLTGDNDVTDAMKTVLEMGPKMIACTDGSEGAYFTDGSIFIKSKVYDVDVMDTTGAGDAFASGVIMGIIRGANMEKVVKMGAAVAAFECSELGVRDGIPHDFQTLEKFIAENKIEISTEQITT